MHENLHQAKKKRNSDATQTDTGRMTLTKNTEQVTTQARKKTEMSQKKPSREKTQQTNIQKET